jgi:hypothetical protein
MNDKKDLVDLPLASKIAAVVIAIPALGILLIAVGLLVKAVKWAWS